MSAVVVSPRAKATHVPEEGTPWRAYHVMNSQAMVSANTLQLTYEFARENPRYALMYLLVIAMMPVQEILTPHLYGRVVTAIEQRRDLVRPIVYVAVLVVALQIYAVVTDVDDAVHMPKLEQFLRKRAVSAIMERHETNFEELETGGIISQLAKLPYIMYKFMDTFKYGVFPTALTMAVGLCYFAYHDRVLAALFVAVAAVVGLSLLTTAWRCISNAMARDNEFTRMLEGLDDILQNLISVYNSASQPCEDKRLDEIQEGYARYTKATMLCVSKVRVLVTPLQIVFIALFMWRCYHMVLSRKLTAGKFVSLFFVMIAINNCISRSITSARETVFRQGIIAESLQIFDRPNPKNPKPPPVVGSTSRDAKAVEIAAKGEVLSADKVTWRYPGAKRPTLDAVTLSVRRGDHIVVTGHIGSGKSTLLRLFMRYHLPDVGEMYLHGVPYASLSARDIRRRIAYVPQQPVLFNRSVYSNIVYAVTRGACGSGVSPGVIGGGVVGGAVEPKRIEALINELGLGAMFADMPLGLRTLAGKRGSRLSGGQRQIVWLLRVMLQEPDILLLDEPTSAIDVRTKTHVQKLLSRVMTGRTVIMVSHDEKITASATRYVHMAEGRIVSQQSLKS